jgi:hypothetical protein
MVKRIDLDNISWHWVKPVGYSETFRLRLALEVHMLSVYLLLMEQTFRDGMECRLQINISKFSVSTAGCLFYTWKYTRLYTFTHQEGDGFIYGGFNQSQHAPSGQ